ncbi:aromatic-ring-hydroxylating dioxygenase subunit beta [Kyrpidia tusciae]|uniref:Aromatic-ring-hydroxylating dioxygenase beta subunit n=1 Tax=Kyrpidia tusciae (strain DSM 2912 / NBRC 15312 / T2) TaxID=562970 RepID=D5WS33_KYRT2|nr:aromatic-ring-hydroxylating dioxygenase subunit beta [Kyrpidia tusciae]ADG06985.1 aromatic-ring-hydroxylating dioxygenase beta subunit [Kyrpidia tusciae DSM 2912]
MTNLEILKEIETFLYREAYLLDQGDFEAWLDLFTDEAVYWMPTTETRDNDQEKSPVLGEWHLIEDDKYFLRKRYERMQTRLAHAEQPRSRTRRFVTNIFILDNVDDNSFVVHSNFIVYQSRLEHEEYYYVGRREDTLIRDGDSWKILRRYVYLDQRVLPRAISVFF